MAQIFQPLIVSSLQQLLDYIDQQFKEYRPTTVILVTIICVTFFFWICTVVNTCWKIIREKGIQQLFCTFLRSIPSIREQYQQQQTKTINKIKTSVQIGQKKVDEDSFNKLPNKPLPAQKILTILHQRWSKDPTYQTLINDHIKIQQKSEDQQNYIKSNGQNQNYGQQQQQQQQQEEESEVYQNQSIQQKKCGFQSKVSGAIYIAGQELKELLVEAYCMFCMSNPLHFDVFPSVRVIEQEVVRMTGSILGADENCCGCITSGGSESILLTVKAARDYMRYHKGITRPELIIADSAHSSYYKAAEYFGIRLIIVPVDQQTYQLSQRQVKRYISSNTIMVVASAPGYPHGIIDDVQGIAKLTKQRGILLHVDCCLGGFVLPFMKKLGYNVPSFDFTVDGVTSISADTHKFGMSHKGTAVLLYKNAAIRKFQYTSTTEWSGGLYVSPGLAGSRAGGLSVTAWASLLYHGWEGYLDSTKKIMTSAQQFVQGMQNIKGLEVIGKPDMCVIAWKSIDPDINIYAVNDLMSSKGWSLNTLQRPAGIHLCFTLAHTHQGWVQQLLDDLQDSVQKVKKNPEIAKEGSAPMYGASNQTVDRDALGEFLVAFQDMILDG